MENLTRIFGVSIDLNGDNPAPGDIFSHLEATDKKAAIAELKLELSNNKPNTPIVAAPDTTDELK